MSFTRRFNGMDYLDGSASDPLILGWMQGQPPLPAQNIRFEDDQFLSFPRNRWALSHLRELMPTASVARRTAVTDPWRAPDVGQQAAIDALSFTDLNGQATTWAQSLPDTYTDGMLVLHQGRCVYERYLGALSATRPHACFSITKSYAATLAATLVHEGVLDARQHVPHYLPEMRGTAYADATLRDVMDMQVGVAYAEDYADPHAPFWDYTRAAGFRPRPPGYTGATDVCTYLQGLQPQGSHGQAFAYKTVNTEVLCWVMARVTGLGLARLLAARLWQPLGCSEEGYLTVDPLGTAFGGAGLSATLRDMALFGELMRCEGAQGGQQIIPAAVVADIAGGGCPAKFAKAGYTLLGGFSYRNMWWVTHNAHGAFEARGIHGQRLYVAPGADLVVARFGSHPVATSTANDPITLPAFLALGQMLQGGYVRD